MAVNSTSSVLTISSQYVYHTVVPLPLSSVRLALDSQPRNEHAMNHVEIKDWV